MIIKEATDLLSLDLKAIAQAIGRSYPTVAAYRAGDREATPDVLRTLAGFMEDHAKAIRQMSVRVAAEADRLDDKR
ncbi:hypothetical protein, partial [Longimicrobium sp.]|uniref:hypothetical protein n=1 Tax=Longimicrobium sp. TaxID=2029185 RepID=UPI002F9230AE